MENCFTYKDRMNERQRILSQMNILLQKLKDCDEKINNLHSQYNRKKKRENIEKKLQEYDKERLELEYKLTKIRNEYIGGGIPVPRRGGYDIENGLLGMKRDLNLILTGYLEEDEIIQVIFT
jgi:hypothetical protein